MSFACDANTYVPMDPPGDFGDLGTVSLESIDEREDGLRIVVDGESAGKPARVSLLFRHVLAYLVCNESYRLLAAEQIVSTIGPSASLLYVVDGSEWIDRFVEESGGIVSKGEVEHYLVATGDDWVDVIGQSPPQIEFLRTKAR